MMLLLERLRLGAALIALSFPSTGTASAFDDRVDDADFAYGTMHNSLGMNLGLAVSAKSYPLGSTIEVLVRLKNQSGITSPPFYQGRVRVSILDSQGHSMSFQQRLNDVSSTTKFIGVMQPSQSRSFYFGFVASQPGSYTAAATQPLFGEDTSTLITTVRSATTSLIVAPSPIGSTSP